MTLNMSLRIVVPVAYASGDQQMQALLFDTPLTSLRPVAAVRAGLTPFRRRSKRIARFG